MKRWLALGVGITVVTLSLYPQPTFRRDWSVGEWYQTTTRRERLLMYYTIRYTSQLVGSMLMGIQPEFLSPPVHKVLEALQTLTVPAPEEVENWVETLLRDPQVRKDADDKHLWYFLFTVVNTIGRQKLRR